MRVIPFSLPTGYFVPMNMLIPKEDQEFILSQLKDSARTLSNEHVLITGATGFFGKWLTQSLLAMDRELGLNLSLTLVTRNKERALKESPWLKKQINVEWIESDIRELKSKKVYTTIIHGAAAASRDLNENHSKVMFDTIVDGTKKVLQLTENSPCKRVLFISSGAVYGTQPPLLSHIPEDYMGGPDLYSPQAAYAEAKRAAEFLCAAQSRTQGFELKIARCFAFVGPYLPLDIHFAAGNFLKEILENKTITLSGDGSPLRSYLYTADLLVWLLKILLNGTDRTPYNVGSDQALSILELAQILDKIGEKLYPERKNLHQRILMTTPKSIPTLSRNIYVPSIKRAQAELGLEVWTDLQSALIKTLRWYEKQGFQ